MKFLFTFLVGMLSVSCSFAQYQFSLTLLDNKGAPLPNKAVSFIEVNTFERMVFKTDGTGHLNMVFDHGKEWACNVGEMYNCLRVKTDGRGAGSNTLTYDLQAYQRENRIAPDRRKMTFEEVPQKLRAMNPPASSYESIIRVVLANKTEEVFPNVPVTLTCYATLKKYTTVTNHKGEAFFEVPNSQEYEIDVDEVNGISYVDIDDRSRASSIFLLYEKRRFTEKEVDGCTEQQFTADIVPSSSHAKVTMTIYQDGQKAINEPVYLRTNKSSKMYKATTNKEGVVCFMLPIKNTYLVDFTFQKDASVIDLTKVKGLAQQNRSIDYVPDPRLQNIEKLIPRVKDLVSYDIESFLSEQYPSPTNDVELFLKWGNKFNASSKEAIVEIGFKVRDRKAGESYPKNFMFVVDVSGSMASDDRLELVKNSLIEIVKKSNTTDQMGLVIFSDDGTLVFPPKVMTDKQALTEIIKVLQPTGGTNISSGLLLGLETLSKMKKEGFVNRLVLLTDGYGGDNVIEILKNVKPYVDGGIQISAIGVGPDFNEALLSQLSTAGGGLMHMAGDPTNLKNAFFKEFEGCTNPIGDKVKLEVTFNKELIYRQLIGYNNVKSTSGKVEVDVPQLFPNLQKMALAKFDVINCTQEIEKQPLIVKLTYTDGKTKAIKVVEKKIYPEWTTATGALDMQLDKKQKKILMVAIANQCMKNMANSYEAGDKKSAEAAIRSGVDQINTLFPAGKPAEMETLMLKLNEYVTVFEDMKRIKIH